ncbi:MAG: hypothetical protein V4693_10755 [Pseudomonadota bacterium]
MALDDAQPRSWFIDAWLPLEGSAFISLRRTGADIWLEADDEEQDPAATALVLRAPAFDAEHIERRIAFGAIQRGAQESFSLDGVNEFSFESVAQVTAFVRRVYSGGGPGSTGGPALEPADGGPGAGPWPQLAVAEADTADARWYLARDVSESPGLLESKMAATCSAGVRYSAANLLIGIMRHAFDSEALARRFAAVAPQLHAAMLLTPDARGFWQGEFLEAIERSRDTTTDPSRADDLWAMSRMVRHFSHEPRWLTLPWRDIRYVDWRHLEIPVAVTRPLKLPARVTSWLDAVCYISADRRYLSGEPFSTWGPLLLALHAPRVVAASAAWQGGSWAGREHPVDASRSLIARCMRMAVELLPAEALPPGLEDNIELWCKDSPPSTALRPAGTPPST